MYAIRSYYADFNGILFDELILVAAAVPDMSHRLFFYLCQTIEELVITSYSIHYTKLYEFQGVFLPARHDLRPDGFAAHWRVSRFAAQGAERLRNNFV